MRYLFAILSVPAWLALLPLRAVAWILSTDAPAAVALGLLFASLFYQGV